MWRSVCLSAALTRRLYFPFSRQQFLWVTRASRNQPCFSCQRLLFSFGSLHSRWSSIWTHMALKQLLSSTFCLPHAPWKMWGNHQPRNGSGLPFIRKCLKHWVYDGPASRSHCKEQTVSHMLALCHKSQPVDSDIARFWCFMGEIAE